MKKDIEGGEGRKSKRRKNKTGIYLLKKMCHLGEKSFDSQSGRLLREEAGAEAQDVALRFRTLNLPDC